MPLTDAQMTMIKKVGKYYAKHLVMIQSYKNAQTYAVSDYKDKIPNPMLQKLYEAAWKTMPKNYEDQMKAVQNRLKKWVRKYAAKVFMVNLSDSEVDSIVSSIMSEYSPASP
jgi:hypothetical protein